LINEKEQTMSKSNLQSTQLATSAKTTLSVLKGDAMILKGKLIEARRERMSTGEDTSAVPGLESLLRQNEYAQAAVFTFAQSGKSALKAAADLGFEVEQNEL
jgi:hypothetical protein